MKRRDILIAGLSGATIPLKDVLAAPCPPSQFGVAGGTSTTASCGSNGQLAEDLPSQYVTRTPLTWIGWDAPTIACPGIDVAYKMTGYDWFNRPLSWSIVSGPSGMTIDAKGYIRWVPPTNGVNQSVTVRMTPGSGTPVDKSFVIQVNAARCKFVSTSGSDSNNGSSASSPYRTVGKAMDVVCAAPSGGWLVLIRGGSYTETWTNSSNWWGNNFTSTNPLIVRGYPGEAVTIANTQKGFGNYSDYLVYYGFNITGGTESENSCLNVNQRNVAKLINGSGFRTANFNNNPTGFKTSGDCILDTCTSGDNYTPGGLGSQNNSNYLHFCDAGSNRDAFYIDCISTGQSVVGFKLKHSGADRVHYHRCVTYGTPNGFDVKSDWSTVRHSLAVADQSFAEGNRAVINYGGSSGSQTDLGMLFDANLIIAKSGENACDLGYGGSQNLTNCPVWRSNTVVALANASTSYPGINWPVRRQSYGSAVSSPTPRKLIKNVFYSPSSAQVQINATTGNSILSIALVNSEPGCSQNTHAGTLTTAIQFTAAGKAWTFTPGTGALTSVDL